MRITLQRKTGKWTLSGMDEFHLALLRKVAADVSYSQSPEGRARLFPKPLSEEEALSEEEFMEDWKEFVVEDMEDKFTADVRTLLSDLEQVKPQQRKDEVETASPQRLTLPLENAPAWFSALNQARLMLELRHKFHDEHDQFVADPQNGALTEEALQERFVAFLRYEFFCMIQEWIVRHAL
jgi:hypothetical protein